MTLGASSGGSAALTPLTGTAVGPWRPRGSNEPARSWPAGHAELHGGGMATRLNWPDAAAWAQTTGSSRPRPWCRRGGRHVVPHRDSHRPPGRVSAGALAMASGEYVPVSSVQPETAGCLFPLGQVGLVIAGRNATKGWLWMKRRTAASSRRSLQPRIALSRRSRRGCPRRNGTATSKAPLGSDCRRESQSLPIALRPATN